MHDPPHPGEIIREERMQLSYDLWQAKRRADGLKVIRFEAPEPA